MLFSRSNLHSPQAMTKNWSGDLLLLCWCSCLLRNYLCRLSSWLPYNICVWRQRGRHITLAPGYVHT